MTSPLPFPKRRAPHTPDGPPWRLRFPNGRTRPFRKFQVLWMEALKERGRGEEPTIDYDDGSGEWKELHRLIIPIEYIGKDDQSSRVRRLVEQKIVMGALRDYLGLPEDADMSEYLRL